MHVDYLFVRLQAASGLHQEVFFTNAATVQILIRLEERDRRKGSRPDQNSLFFPAAATGEA